MSAQPWPVRFRLQIDRIHDGDTIMGRITADAGLGMEISLEDWAVRFYGINAPELSTDAGKTSLAYLEALLADQAMVYVDSYGWDKYGRRIDGVPITVAGVDLCQAMLAAGMAAPYPS